MCITAKVRVRLKERKASISSLNDSLFFKEMIMLIEMISGPTVQVESIPVFSHSTRVALTFPSLSLFTCRIQIIIIKTFKERRLPRTSLDSHETSSSQLSLLRKMGMISK